MLVVSLRYNERAVINNGEIFVKLLEINGNTIRLGFDAPGHIPIDRERIWLRILADSGGGA